jgi:hypothetical protein
MNLISFSIKTKGAHNFARRLATVFTRFGFSETPTRQARHITNPEEVGCIWSKVMQGVSDVSSKSIKRSGNYGQNV